MHTTTRGERTDESGHLGFELEHVILARRKRIAGHSQISQEAHRGSSRAHRRLDNIAYIVKCSLRGGVAPDHGECHVANQLLRVVAFRLDQIEQSFDRLVMPKDDAVLALPQPWVQESDAALEILVTLPEVNQVGAELHTIIRNPERDILV